MLRADLAAAHKVELALARPLEQLMFTYADRQWATEHPVQEIIVDRPKARFSSWYELFPRSCGAVAQADRPQPHGTLRDVCGKLPLIAEMGFDVLYLPPIHPIGDGVSQRKEQQSDGRAGRRRQPWGIGSAEGGHMAFIPQLGTLDDFRQLIAAAAEHSASNWRSTSRINARPIILMLNEHELWFRKRPDGTMQYAENPPKKYQDIYPFDFETPIWQSLWHELNNVFEYWIARRGAHFSRR